MIGTRKGLWLARSTDTPRLLMGSRHWHIGPQVMHSDDLGRTWSAAPDGGVAFPEDTGSTVEAIWSLGSSAAEPGVVYAGTEPSALFRSTDRGETFELVRGLWDHPHRTEWAPGGGGQAIHTLLPHPTDAGRMHVAMSTGGG